MTHRSRNGGPPKTHKKGSSAAPVHQRKLHHPPVKKDEPESDDTTPSASTSNLVCPAELLEAPSDKQILDLLYAALRATISSPDFVPTIQRIKALLYEEKWLEVFENRELLHAYAGRWVPSRALCFREFMGCLDPIRELFEGGSDDQHVLSLGGGAGSELVALASLVRGIRGDGHRYTTRQNEDGSDTEPEYGSIKWTGVDIGAWNEVIDTLGTAVQGTWKNDIERHYIQTNLLDQSSTSTNNLFQTLDSSPPTLTTLFFTLTELLSQSPQKTIALLSRLTDLIPRGSLFLVTDSASDISSFSLGAGGREWPTYTIIDLVMLRLLSDREADDGGAKWEKLEGSDSRWFRMAPGTGQGWPIKLENARYWFRLYQRL